jgi:molybdopterin-synthase adenylyltransferase
VTLIIESAELRLPANENAAPEFDYITAFSRNVGWVTEAEQLALRSKRVAVAGLGGVGGFHVLTLARLGIGAFNLADFDTFGVENFNRQAGATVSTIGRAKVDVICEAATAINPDLKVKTFPDGVSRGNLDEFLSGVDLYVDGLDFFAFDARRETFAACARLNIPAITSAPLGVGVAHLNFLPGQMSFEEYFRLEGLSESEQALRFLLGLAPRMLQRSYLVDPTRVHLAERRGPSTIMACQLCSGVAAAEGLKILLGRGNVLAAPHGFQFDAYRGKLVKTWRPGGNRNPLQRLALRVARRKLGLATTRTEPSR